MSRPEGEELVGQTIAGKYEIVRLLGQGGMGAVYQARQVAMDRMVALKVIRPELLQTKEVAARFQQEMRLTAKIEHPNTVRLYDVFESEGRMFLAMEYLAGTQLTKVIDGGELWLGRIVHIGKQIANALGAIHARGVIHRDLKPDNVMLLESYGDHDFVKVLDFGVAKPLDEGHASLTVVGSIVGTPAYMAPEQALARPVDARADLYSLGIILYQMVSGRVPFEEASMTSMLLAHATTPPPQILAAAPGTSPELGALIMQLLEKEPAARPQTAFDVAARLEACLQQPTAPGIVPQPTRPPPAPPKPRRMALYVVLGLLVAGAITTAVVLGSGSASVSGPDSGSGSASVSGSDSGSGSASVSRSDSGSGSASASRSDSGSPSAPASRSPLDALFTAADEPLAPESCRATDAATIARLETAARAVFGGDTDGALAALATVPDGAEALTLRARAELPRDAAQALASADKAIALCPTYAVAHNVAGNAYQKLGKIEPAEEAYSRALGEIAAYDAPRYNLGVSQLRRKDPGAVWTFTELLKRRPDYPDARLVRAQAYLLKGNAEAALADLEEAVRLQPKSADAWAALGQLREYIHRGDWKAAYCEAKKLGNAEAAKHCE